MTRPIPNTARGFRLSAVDRPIRIALAGIVSSLLIGCQNSAEPRKREVGALGGGALGAGLGAIIGSQTGTPGAGVAIGATAGALSGGVIGNELDRNDDRISQNREHLKRQEVEIDENRRMIEELRKNGADVYSTDRGVVVNLPDVLFEFDSARLTPEAKNTVVDIVRAVDRTGERRIVVEGHTDSTGTITYNQQLSEDRARSVADELTKSGVSKRAISSKGFGESDPVASNSTESGRRRNRRVEVIIENRR